MASIILNGGNVHDDEAVTPSGLRRVLRTMRWSDLEEVAHDLEYSRKGDTDGKSSKPFTARAIADWLESVE